MKTLAQAQMCKNIPVVQRQPTRQKTTYATEINKQSNGVNTCLGTIATDQFDPWQVVHRQVFTSYSRLLISTAFVVVSLYGCLGVTGVLMFIKFLVEMGNF